MKNGYGEVEILEALQKLEALGYMDDRAVASSLARQARELKNLGKRGAALYLAKRGVPGDYAGEALASYEEREAARRLVEKRMRGLKGLPPEVRRRRIFSALQRRGFSSGTIYEMLRIEEEQ